MGAGEFAWVPPAQFAARTHIERFIAAHALSGFDELRRRAVDEPEWFWDSVVAFLGIPFAKPYSKVLDVGNGIEWATWFVDGTLNFAAVCVDRWAETRGDRDAVVWEGEDGDVRSWDYHRLRSEADRLAFML